MSTLPSSPSFKQYRKIRFGNVIYYENDVILFTDVDGSEVGIINYIYDSNDENLLNIRKYVFARKLNKVFKKQGLEYDKQNEVVQDLSQCYDISLKQIIRKCTIAFLCPEDNVFYIDKNRFDTTECYSCRFSIKGNQLFPLFSESNTSLSDNTLFTPTTKILSENNNTPNQTMTLNNSIEVCFDNEYYSPTQRNLVKRNLNKSFGNSPSTKNNSILNYSIESLSDDDNDRLVLKLKVSKNTRSPTKRNAIPTENTVSSPPKIRKSGRSTTRKSYADYLSPIKINKRFGYQDKSSDDEDFKTTRTTPKRTPIVNKEKLTSISSSKRKVKPPQHYAEESKSMYQRTPRGTPARKSLKLSVAESNNSPTRSSRRKALHSSSEDDNLGVIGTLENENLNDSLRTNLFKSALVKAPRDENNKNLINVAESSDSETDDNENNTKDLNKSFTNTLRVNLKKLNLSNEENVSGSQDASDELRKDLNNKSVTNVLRVHLMKLNVSNEDNSCGQIDSDEASTPKKVSRRKVSTPKSTKTAVRTPRSVKTSKTVSKSPEKTPRGTPRTPKNTAKLIREGIVTPSMQERSKKIKGDTTPLMKARSQLHVSYIPESLPCREKEYCDIYNFVEGKLLDGCGGCMYISGVPGTGKTATVTSVMRQLESSKGVPKFKFVNVNGMRLTEPRQAYVEILKQLTGKTVSWEQAQNSLEEIFVKSKKKESIVMLIDELDILCTKRQDVVYNLLDWPTKAKYQLVVISIANTMDLPERLLMNRVTSRLGLTRLTFQAYTFKQLQEIVMKRLFGTDSFNPDAVQFVARKVASVSGDARRALDICRRAAEIAESEGKSQLVTMTHVNEALNAMITQPKVLAIKHCSKLEQIIMQSIVAEVERTGVEETTFCDVYKMLVTCSAIEGFKMVSSTIAQRAVCRLSASRLILADQKCNNIHQKIILNVSIDDVYYALQKNNG
uniref:Origin recognition complex subunit 1 n=1 Tax=Diabrotica virgifera virgifera TaxID=50390 RepID=A0A6P7FC55_DIAVI